VGAWVRLALARLFKPMSVGSPSETSNGSEVVTPQPRKARVVKPSTPASKLATAAGPPSLYLRKRGRRGGADGRKTTRTRRKLEGQGIAKKAAHVIFSSGASDMYRAS